MVRSVRDSWVLLASCCALTIAFICARIWVASKIKVEHFIKIFSEGLRIFQNLLPVSIEDLASPLGRSAFSYEELPVILLLGLWTVSRASDCMAGRVAAGTMEMLLAQPLRRIEVAASHSLVTLGGVAALVVASVVGLAWGIQVSDFDAPPRLAALAPSAFQYAGLGVFWLGAATLVSAIAATRAQAVAAVLAIYVVELALMLIARISPSVHWLENLTILSAYEPTLLALGLEHKSAEYWPLFWQYNAWLFGLGAALWGAGTTIFCRRDLPAPL
jgi:ABC-type transport system involved in multi-copper enzyme maturation permease subunit